MVESNETSTKQAGMLGCGVRMLWMLVANAALFFLVVFIGESHGAFSRWDVLFWLVVVAAIVLRFVDIKFLGGRDTDGNPATLADWARYARLMVIVTGLLWVLAHVVGRVVLG